MNTPILNSITKHSPAAWPHPAIGQEAREHYLVCKQVPGNLYPTDTPFTLMCFDDLLCISAIGQHPLFSEDNYLPLPVSPWLHSHYPVVPQDPDHVPYDISDRKYDVMVMNMMSLLCHCDVIVVYICMWCKFANTYRVVTFTIIHFFTCQTQSEKQMNPLKYVIIIAIKWYRKRIWPSTVNQQH